MFKKEKKMKSNYYFDQFPVLAHYSVVCGEKILDFLKHFDPRKSEEIKSSVHEVEHEADNVKHEVTAKLLKEFMTPIDREDIFELLKLVDDVTDAIEEISLRLYLYNYQSLPDNTVEFMDVTLKCMEKMEECLKQFPNYLKEEIFVPYVNEVVKLEERSDELYIENVHALYLKKISEEERYKAETLYSLLEEVSDKCREVCRFVQNIALKNI